MVTSKDATVPVYVVRAEDNFLSFDELNKRHFPMSELDSSKVLPKSVTERSLFSPLGENSDEEQPIAVFQVNFIKGGLVLGVAIHHSCSDGPGCDGFLTTWAERRGCGRSRAALPPQRPGQPRPVPAERRQYTDADEAA